jgi:hypothetical protein
MGDAKENKIGVALDEVVGLFYGGFVLVGMAAGAFTGYLLGGGREEFLVNGWVDTMIGTVTGLFIGVGLGLISHGIFTVKKSRLQ